MLDVCTLENSFTSSLFKSCPCCIIITVKSVLLLTDTKQHVR